MSRLGVAPSEFWQMPPEHFWWLVEASTDDAKPTGLDPETINELQLLLARAEEGLF